MKQKYQALKFKPKSLELLSTINSILNELTRQGIMPTVRSLYYQLVARGFIENNEKVYKSITKLVSDGRIAGLLDWDQIEDRMRAFRTLTRWGNAADALDYCARSFHMDMWLDQEKRVFAIIEKDALLGTVVGTCDKWDTPILAARGYPSSSVIRDFVKYTLIPAVQDGQDVVILHMGDHDPSGIDMSRDLEERINFFSEGEFNTEVRRLALNMNQIEQYNPPPNPAKSTDSRFQSYREQHGDESWELDALSPQVTNELLSRAIEANIDFDLWTPRADQIAGARKKMIEFASTFNTK